MMYIFYARGVKVQILARAETGFNMYGEYTQPQLTFLALVPSGAECRVGVQ